MRRRFVTQIASNRVARAPGLPRDLPYPLAMPMRYPDLQCRLPPTIRPPPIARGPAQMLGQISVGDLGQNCSGGMAADIAARHIMEAKPRPAAAAALPSSATTRGDQVALAYRTAGELLQALATRNISSREPVDDAIARIETLDPKINAAGRCARRRSPSCRGRESRRARCRRAPSSR